MESDLNTGALSGAMKMTQRATIEVDEPALVNLFRRKALSLNDFRCSDRKTKKLVWRCYLTALKEQMAAASH